MVSIWFSTVPMSPVLWPAAESRCLIRKTLVVLPLVPVTPMNFIFSAGRPK